LPSETRHPRGAVRNSIRPVFGFVGNDFGERKNTTAALEAFSLLLKHIPGARLVLIGRGHALGNPGHEWARERGLIAGTEWRGELTNALAIDVLRDEIDILLHPSHWEACSIAIMEAQALGLPVIGNLKTPGTSYSLLEGKAGILIDADDPTAMASGMARLVNDPLEYHRISRGGIQALDSPFNLDLVLDEYERAYALAAPS